MLRFLCRLTHHAPPQKMHVCQICGKSFAQASLLKKHLTSAHSGDRRFSCPYCPAAFKRKDHADRHVADTHTLVAGLFECDVCGGRFQSAVRLKQHSKLHTDDATLRQPCTLCGKRMLVKNLVTHYNRAHAAHHAYSTMVLPTATNQDSTSDLKATVSDFVSSILAS